MAKYKCMLSYDGTHFSGFQIQTNKRTIQGELEQALAKIHKDSLIRIHPSGRTDTGVHALEQTIHFESPLELSSYNWCQAMNTLLPDDIVVKQVVSVPDSFHARYDAETKEYRYYVWNEKEIDVFKRNYAYQFRYPLDVAAMQEACHYFEGTHDFTTFSSAKATIRGSKTRTLHHVACHQQGSQIEFIFHGSGFLYNMVRIIVGTLLDIGQGKRKAVDIPWLLEQKDRRLLGMTVPPQGLYLWKVTYGQAETHNPDTLDS